MWKAVFVGCPTHVIAFSKGKRSFTKSSAICNWILNSDIVRNALSSKNQRINRNEERTDLKLQEEYLNRNRVRSKQHKQQGGGRNAPFKKKSVLVRWTTGTERDKAAANSVVNQILRMNSFGTINVLNSKSNKIEETDIRTFARQVNLLEVGFSIADVQQVSETSKIPLVKLVDRKTAVKKYSDELAKRKQAELVKMGVIKKTQVKANDSEKTEDSIKQIKMSWQIKDDDLSKQKAHEITSQLKKGYKVHLYLDDKSCINSKNWTANFEDPSTGKLVGKGLGNKERACREALLDKLDKIVDEFSVQPVKHGNIETKMMIKLAPKPFLSDQKGKERLALKEQRKLERKQKLLRRIEKKKHRQIEA